MIKKGIQLNNRKLVNTILYADDQILMATSEDELQTMAYHLNILTRKYGMTISSTKTKSMAMWGNHIHRAKIVINKNIIEQVTYFKYCMFSFGYIPGVRLNSANVSESSVGSIFCYVGDPILLTMGHLRISWPNRLSQPANRQLGSTCQELGSLHTNSGQSTSTTRRPDG